ncbi:MAG: DUF389 domain-containing protein [Synechococcus sp.]
MFERILAWMHWLRDKFVGEWRVTLREQLPYSELIDLLLKESIPSFSFYFLLTLSAIIATMGLVSNSAATIIGAMIIAPLKAPIDTLSFGLVRFDVRLIRRSLLTLSTGVALTILVAYSFSIAIGSRFAGLEILARGNPNLLDLVVALAAGAAGAFSLTRRKISGAPAGVAIAVALVPPLCVVGIGLGLGDQLSGAHIASVGESRLAVGAALLFFTNLVAIAFSGAIVFLLGSYSTLKLAAPGMAIALVCVLGVTLPLNSSLREMVIQNLASSEIRQSAFEYFPDWNGQVDGLFIESRLRGNTLFLKANITAPENLIGAEETEILQKALASKMNLPVDLNIRVLPYQSFAVHPNNPLFPGSEEERG